MADYTRFLHSTDEVPEHPRLSAWLQLPAKERHVDVRRERDGLTFRPTRIVFIALQEKGDVFSDEQEWDALLNDGLVRRGIRAISPQTEQLRFGLVLEARLEPVEQTFGDGFFNKALVDFLQASGLNLLGPVQQALAQIYRGKGDLTPALRDNCFAMLDHAISQCGQDLIQRLRYTEGEAILILAGAIACYLDDRFHLTNRRILGF
jgi:hypothetical protein